MEKHAEYGKNARELLVNVYDDEADLLKEQNRTQEAAKAASTAAVLRAQEK